MELTIDGHYTLKLFKTVKDYFLQDSEDELLRIQMFIGDRVETNSEELKIHIDKRLIGNLEKFMNSIAKIKNNNEKFGLRLIGGTPSKNIIKIEDEVFSIKDDPIVDSEMSVVTITFSYDY